VHYGRFMMLAGESGLELQDAAGIARSDDVDSEMGNQFGFAIAKGLGGVGLHEIVDARGATADGGFGNFGEFQPGDAGEQSARLRANALRVLQMAGVVKGHA